MELETLTGMDIMFLHTVLFWLKDDISKDEIKKFEKGLSDLTAISTVRFKFVGMPASTRRPVIDSTYSYKLVVGFDGIEGHDSYQVDDAHLKFLKECSGLWTKVQIYDAE